MLLSNKYKFIFIRTQKTASTSLELFFGKYCNEPDDIVTTLTPDNFNYEIYKHNRLTYKNLGIREHSEWDKIKEAIGDQKWNDYFKFCFTRNPWAKAVSYYWERGFDRDFDFWAMDNEDSKGENSICYISGNKIMVDFIGKVETLNSDVQYIMDKLKLPGKCEIPHYRNGYKNRKIHYSYYYTGTSKNRIEKLFHKQIKLFGYKFEDKPKPRDKIILNIPGGMSAFFLNMIVKRITSLLTNKDGIEPGYINITEYQNPFQLSRKYPEYKIISLVPNLTQDYHDVVYTLMNLLNKDQKQITRYILANDFPWMQNIVDTREAENILYVDSFHLRRNLKSTFFKIAEFLNILIKDIYEISNLYRTNNEELKRFIKIYFFDKQTLVKGNLNMSIAKLFFDKVNPPFAAYV